MGRKASIWDVSPSGLYNVVSLLQPNSQFWEPNPLMFSFSENSVINLIWHFQRKTNSSQGKETKIPLKPKQIKPKTSGMLQLFNQIQGGQQTGGFHPFWKEIFIQMVGHLSVKNCACEHCDVEWSLYWLNIFMSIYHWACESNFTCLVKKQWLIDKNIVVYKTLSHNLQCL